MSDEGKTKKQLIDELVGLRRRDAEQSRIEAQLRESENRYRTIVENMLDVAYTCSADGTITYISPQAYSLGDSPEAVVGHNIMEFVHPDDADRVLTDMQRAMQTGEEFPTVFRLINPDGEVFYVEETGKVIRDGEQIVGITGTLRDVSQRMEMEETLKVERDKVQQYLDIAGVIIVAIDADKKVTLVNKKGCEVLGYTADEIVGKDWFDSFLPERVRGEVKNVFQKLMSGNIAAVEHYENPVMTKIGDERIIAWHNTVLRDKMGNITGTLGSGNDITERVEAENELRKHRDHLEELVEKRTSELTQANEKLQSEIAEREQIQEELRLSTQRWQTTFNAISDSICLVDTEMKILQCNKAMVDFLGKPSCEIIGRICYELVHGTSEPPEGCPGARTLKTHQRESASWLIKDRWFNVTTDPLLDASGNLMGVVHIMSDVTDRRKASEALQESEEKYRNLYETMAQGVVYQDADGKIISANPAAERILDLTLDQMRGRTSVDSRWRAIHEDGSDFPGETHPAMIALRTGERVSNVIMGVFSPVDQKHRWILVDAVPHFRPDEDKPYEVYTTFDDITDLKQMEEELLKNEKLESIGVLAGGIAHEFNNILTGILGNISLARTYRDLDRIQRRLLEAENASIKAKSLTQRLLTFASGGAPILRRASIESLLRNSTTLALRDSSIRCKFSISDDLWDVEIDEGQIEQVINNIITNSVQAMPAGGIIGVNAENIDSDEEHGTPLQKGLYVKIAIEDQGRGIHEEHLQKIFDPFFTTDRRRSGLGLSAAHSIVRNHKGHITVKSRVGVGTTFYIYLPAFSEETPKEPEETEKSIMGSLLVMDDDDIVREVASEVLISAGYRVTPVRNGAEAIESYKSAMESGNPFDAIILDLTVPGGMGGKETLRRLILVDPGVKAVVASGYSNDPVVTDFEKYGFKGVIAKPYTAMELIKLLNEVLAKDA